MAVTLDPRNKHEYFLRNWDKKHIPGMRRKTESMFEEFRLTHDVAASVDISNSPSHFNVDLIDDFDINEWRFGGIIPKESELQRYLKSPLMILGEKSQIKSLMFGMMEGQSGRISDIISHCY